MQAGAARTVIDLDRDAAKSALSNVEQNARAAIDELHGLVTTLRETEGTSAEQTTDAVSTIGLDDIRRLTDESTQSGLPTRYEVLGDERPVAGTVALTLYRIAQEALTNARKYAGAGATADVRLRFQDAEVELEVANTGFVPSKPRKGALGHVGMRERIAAVGGRIEIGPRSRGGYLVRASIPSVPADHDTAGAAT